LISRIRFYSAGITNDGFDHAFCLVERGLNAPKTPASENRGLDCWRRRIFGATSTTKRYYCNAQKQGKNWDSFHSCDLRQCCSPFVSLFLDLLRRPLLSFLLSVPVREVESAHRQESFPRDDSVRSADFRGSLLIELDSVTDRLDLEKIFGRNAPLHVDLGCGDGSFLCALAERMPEKNFLGIERLLGRIRSAARKAATVGNVRLLRMESSYAVRYLLPAGSVE